MQVVVVSIIALHQTQKMPGIKGVVLVGGPSRGTRFRPLSLNQPKPLFPIAGYPMVHHQVTALAQLPDMREILLIGFFEPSSFAPFIQQVSAVYPKVSIRYLREYQALGTAGGLYHFRDQVLRGQPDCFFVLHADVCCSLPLNAMLKFHLEHKQSLCTIMGTKVPKDVATRYGCLVADEDGKVGHYVEKPETFVSDMISCGMYLFHPDIFNKMQQAVKAHHDKMELQVGHMTYNGDSPDLVRLEQDVLRPMAGTGTLFVYETTEFWRQIKSAGSALPANKLVLASYRKNCPERLTTVSDGKDSKGPTIVGDVFIHPTAQVDPSAKIGPNVSIGPRVIVEAGVRIKESILLDNVEVKAYSCVTFAILGTDTRVGRWCRIEGTPPYATEPNISPASNICTDFAGTVWTAPTTDLMLPSGMKNPSVTILADNVRAVDEVCVRNCIVLPHKELKNTSYKNEILM